LLWWEIFIQLLYYFFFPFSGIFIWGGYKLDGGNECVELNLKALILSCDTLSEKILKTLNYWKCKLHPGMKKKGPRKIRTIILVLLCNYILLQFSPLGIEDSSIYQTHSASLRFFLSGMSETSLNVNLLTSWRYCDENASSL